MSEHKSRKRKSSYLLHVPTAIFLVLSVSILVAIWTPSVENDIFIFSYFRFFSILIIALSALYFTISFLFRSCLKINAYFAYMVVMVTLMLESGLRLVPAIIPDNLIILLPRSAQSEFAARRGMFSRKTVDGEGMHFAYKAHTKFPDRPWVIIDENGFRNPSPPAADTGIVFLGASVVLGLDSEKDMAQLFRETDMTAYSLAMGSYSPQHYLNSYKTFIVDKNIRNKFGGCPR
jgi:hypothetical protein